LAELLLRKAYLPGESDIDQLGKIFAALGTPTEEVWPVSSPPSPSQRFSLIASFLTLKILKGMTSLPDYVAFNPCPATPFKQLFTAAGDDALDLLASMLRFNPPSRISAADVSISFISLRIKIPPAFFFLSSQPLFNRLTLPSFS